MIDSKEVTKLLNIANIVDKTTALGPGIRAAIWVQGCPLNCPGCISPSWIPFEPAIQLTPQQVVDRLLLDEISGLTFSGGEPMEQADRLTEVVRLARRKRDLDVICFTGYHFEALVEKSENTGIPKFLRYIDVLIDGPYISKKNTSVGLRGSENQRFIHLTDRLKYYSFATQNRKVELKLDRESITLVGIPTPKINIAFKNVLEIINFSIAKTDLGMK